MMTYIGCFEGVELEDILCANKGSYIKNEVGKGRFSFQDIISEDPLYKLRKFKRNLSISCSSSEHP